MADPSALERHIAAVLMDWHEAEPATLPIALELADALLADATLAAIIDLAAWAETQHPEWDDDWDWEADEQEAKADAKRLTEKLSPEVRALLADWRTNRAEPLAVHGGWITYPEQEPTP